MLVLPHAFVESIKPCGEEDRASVLALCAEAFGRAVAERLTLLWEWLGRNPCRRDGEALFWGLWLSGQLAGVMGRMPLVLSVGAEEAPGAWSSMLMVRATLQRRGIGGLLMEHFRRTCPVGLLMGLSWDAHRLGLGLGFHEVAPLRWLLRPMGLRGLIGPWLSRLGRRGLAERIPRLPFPKLPRSGVTDIRVREVTGFDGRTAVLWRRAVTAGRVGARRDAAYLNWKYRDHPSTRYRMLEAERGTELKGLAVHRTVETGALRIGTIAELGCDPGADGVVGALLDAILDRFRQEGVDLVRALTLDPSTGRALRRAGFFPVRLSAGLLVHAPDDVLKRISSPRRWILTHGDSDLEQWL
ncbi:MAG: GNAT family N-acetyltransferase [Candidatus Rokubacteria bacterium]|nr:GNAT family N-acetyltransferase [Candidatus Rokubacteria bacterium]